MSLRTLPPPPSNLYRVQATSMPFLLSLARMRPLRLHINAGPPFKPSKLLQAQVRRLKRTRYVPSATRYIFLTLKCRIYPSRIQNRVSPYPLSRPPPTLPVPAPPVYQTKPSGPFRLFGRTRPSWSVRQTRRRPPEWQPGSERVLLPPHEVVGRLWSRAERASA